MTPQTFQRTCKGILFQYTAFEFIPYNHLLMDIIAANQTKKTFGDNKPIDQIKGYYQKSIRKPDKDGVELPTEI